MKQSEDEIVIKLIEHLKQNGWTIESHCLGQKQGNDIVALKGNSRLIVEAKGAKAGNNSPTKRREYFDSGQIKTHFGKAIVKVLDEKYLNPKCKFAIAHPDDIDIRKTIGNLTPFLKTLGIIHYWISADGTVIEE
jgi:hypothetical protein